MDVISILQKKRQVVTGFEVHVHARRAEQHPRVFTQADIEYSITGSQIDEAAVLRAVELSATRYCPAQAMLGQVFPITLKYFIYEQEAAGERRLVSSGEFAQPVATP
jgi:putative redox protein